MKNKFISRNSIYDNAFDLFNICIMLFLIVICIYPFWYCLVGSFNEGFDYIKGNVYLWPRKFTLSNYKAVFADDTILGTYQITILRTVIGTTLHVLFTSLFAYGFSRNILKGRNIYAVIGIGCMYFGGGLIPTYILYKWLGLLDNFLVYVIPGMFSFFHVLILQSFFKGIPDSINESAMIDGAGEYRIFISLILPLSMPVLATITLFEGVHHWNSFMDSMVFTTSPELQTIQVYLMKVIRSKELASSMASRAVTELEESKKVTSTTVQYATMMVTTLPIVILYPFLQKYFVKGIMIGAIKG